MGDKFNRKHVAVGSFFVVCISTLLFDFVTSRTLWVLILAVVLFSLSYGSANTLRAVLIREYFGRSRFGTIFGFLAGVLSMGAMLGPLIAGWVFDVWQSYHYAWIIFTATNLVGLLFLATTPRVYPGKETVKLGSQAPD
jgi:MFS family permease